MDEIEAQLRNLPEGVDPIKAAASEIHRERRAHAGTQSQLARTQGELAQCSVTVGKFNEQAIQQSREIVQQSRVTAVTAYPLQRMNTFDDK